jgi:transcription elongation GreA/GreB family factor
MSRAFVREDAGPVLPDVAERPVPPGPNWVRPAFLARMQADRAALAAQVAALRAGRDTSPDLMPLAVAERDLRWLDARLASAIPVDPAHLPQDEAGLGATVTVLNEDGAKARFTLVGEDEADPKAGLISPFSPLGRSLAGTKVGDLVSWSRPGGDTDLEITAIDWDD